MHAYIHTYRHTYIHACMHACMHIYMCVRVCVCGGGGGLRVRVSMYPAETRDAKSLDQGKFGQVHSVLPRILKSQRPSTVTSARLYKGHFPECTPAAYSEKSEP